MKKKTTFQRLTTFVIWLMLIATIGSLIMGLLISLGLF